MKPIKQALQAAQRQAQITRRIGNLRPGPTERVDRVVGGIRQRKVVADDVFGLVGSAFDGLQDLRADPRTRPKPEPLQRTSCHQNGVPGTQIKRCQPHLWTRARTADDQHITATVWKDQRTSNVGDFMGPDLEKAVVHGLGL